MSKDNSNKFDNIVDPKPESTKDIVATAQNLVLELTDYKDNSEERNKVLDQLRGVFIGTRLTASSAVDKVRARAVNTLLSKIDDLSPNQLLRTIEVLSKATENDLAITQGRSIRHGKVDDSNNIVINNNSTTNTLNQEQNNSLALGNDKSINELSEAVGHILSTFKDSGND